MNITLKSQGEYKNDMIGLEFDPLQPGDTKLKGDVIIYTVLRCFTGPFQVVGLSSCCNYSYKLQTPLLHHSQVQGKNFTTVSYPLYKENSALCSLCSISARGLLLGRHHLFPHRGTTLCTRYLLKKD